MVSRGERLRQVADDLDRAASPTQRDLRLHAIALDLRALARGISGDLGHRLHLFGAGALATIAGRRTADLGVHLRRAGDLLLEWEDEHAVSSILISLRELTHSLVESGSAAAAVEPPAPPAAAPPPPSPDDSLPIVPIESLLFDEPAPRRISVPSLELTAEQPVVPIASLAPEAEPPTAAPSPAALAGLAGSFTTYQRLTATLGRPAVASLDVLMVGTRIEPPARATSPPAAPAQAPSTSTTSPTAPTLSRLAGDTEDGPILDITTLCYRGRAALERAAVVRDQIRVARGAAAPRPEVDPLVEELLDLVELALVESV